MSEYIKREDALEACKRYFRVNLNPVATREDINAIPAADVEPVVRGEWVESKTKHYNAYYPDGFRYTSMYACSNCGRKSKTKHERCLHCFAHMERSGSGE